MIEEKKCPCCKKKKVLSMFSKDKNRKDGMYIYCKKCCREKHKNIVKNNIENKKDIKIKKCNDCGEVKNISYFGMQKASKDGYSVYCFICARIKNKETYKNNRSKRLKEVKNYQEKNKDKISKRRKEDRKNNGTIPEARKHIESTFPNGMTLDNHGKWEVDHILPCASFDLKDLEQQKICFNYKNLQALWYLDNKKKGDKIIV